jgi:hypothetical protein
MNEMMTQDNFDAINDMMNRNRERGATIQNIKNKSKLEKLKKFTPKNCLSSRNIGVAPPKEF